MTYEEALMLLNDMEFSDKYQGKEEYTNMLMLCKQALEKETPKKPKVRGYGIHDEEYDDYHEETRYYCPTCVRRLGILDDETEIPCGIGRQRGWYSHCNHCGQAIDWE